MISFFPAPYEDEILYSMLSRYHLRSGNTSYVTTNEDLYNEGIITSSIDLPSNNGRLVENMPKSFGYTSEEIIRSYTLFNYYTSFVDAHEKQLALEMLKGNDGRGVHSIVGAAQVSVKQQGYFKICPICYKEEIEDYGEAYLHRIHQIPEVFICSKHQVPLKISKQPIHYYGKNSYVPLLEVEFKENITNDLFINNLEHFIAINQYIEFLLSNEVSNKDYLWITDQYKNRLRELCLCTPSGRVNIDEVENRFIKFYGEEFLNLFELNIYSNNITNWIKYMLRISRSNVNPIKHLLLIRFLEINLEEFFNMKIEYKPFGEGPWICLNKICDNYYKPIIESVEISYNSSKRKPVGRFKCECCGFTYARCGPDICEDDKYKIGRTITIGEMYKEEIERYSRKGVSIRYISRNLGIGQRTVKKYLEKL
ncbi:MAG: TnsD family Tn7-like transposition protein [Clostridium sp.]|uniref:TnsD family Tn7-like transposition protein n=1 Tax=Clostridium sp. TaxID=1506 RepID=UPI002904E5E6|nr:TnsD family Tn7-like transposition protein [Clostridium sp.]MDU1604723.1 TnsD family Tn7-like transposition protein [Clostridium sp.]